MLHNIDDPQWNLLTTSHRKQLAARIESIASVCVTIKDEFRSEAQADEVRDILEQMTLHLTCALDEDLGDGEAMSSWRFFVGWTSDRAMDSVSKLTAIEVQALNCQLPDVAARPEEIVAWLTKSASVLLGFISDLRNQTVAGRAVALISAIEILARMIQIELFRSFLSPSFRRQPSSGNT
jgi:hypothetical protein